MILIALCGLPGVGKSTLAEALAAALRAPLLDKDRVREALFGAHFVEYSREQDDYRCEALYATAGWLAARHSVPCAVLDGRTFMIAGQAERLVLVATERGFDPRFVLCSAPRATAIARIERDHARSSHPAANRTRSLYETLEREARSLPYPHLALDTQAEDLLTQVRRVREWVAL
jgi:predicted kinase